MKKYIVLVLSILLFTDCNSRPKVNSKISIDSGIQKDSYPDEISRLGIQDLFDEAKWIMYCLYSDDPVTFLDQSVNDSNSTYGKLALKFDKILIRGDTVEINFYFYLDTIRIDESNTYPFPIWGVVFDIRNNERIQYSTRTTARYFTATCADTNNCKSRFVIPLQPEVIKYIRENKDKIDLWFRKEAINRGVIEEE